MSHKPWLKKTYTLIVVPHAEARFRKIKIPYWMLISCAFTVVGIVTAISVFLFHYFLMLGNVSHVEELAHQKIQLTKENLRYEQLTEDIEHRLDVISDKTRVLSSLAGVDQVVTRGRGDISGFENQLGNERLDRDLPLQSIRLGDLRSTLERVERAFNERREELDYTPSVWPLVSTEIGYISSGMGYRPDPFTRQQTYHRGVDISAPSGTPIIAPANGIVLDAKRWGGYGNVIIIDHLNGYVTYYGHLRAFNVERGDRITRGQVIGLVGNSGKSTSSHLHYEVHRNDEPINPLNYILNHEERIRVWDFQYAADNR